MDGLAQTAAAGTAAAGVAGLLGEPAHWQAALAADAAIFADWSPAARVGLLPRAEAEAMAGTMLVWSADVGGVCAALRPFDGYEGAGVDLLFVAEDAAIEALYGCAAGALLTTMRRLVRRGHVIFFVMKRGRELRALGYEEFLDALGLAFLGACR